MDKKSCNTCKHYSRLVPLPSEFSECHYCQRNHCVYCEHNGANCKDYEYGKNDGGKREYEYDDDDFCQQMIDDYENDSDPEKDKNFTLEECMKEWGIEK